MSETAASTPRSPRDLYLDLMIKVLANTIYRDPSTHPLNRGPFQAELRVVGEDWPLLAHTMVGVRRLENLRALCQKAIDEGVPGDFIETGVWRGGCCVLMRAVLAANAVGDRRVYAADSFAGLPSPRPDLYPADDGWELQHFKQLAVPLDRVRENFARYGLLDEQVVFVPGWFAETLPGLDVGALAVLRLDGDFYESTHIALQALYPKLSPGGFVIVDDFGASPPCREAVSDYRATMGIDAPIETVDAAGIWWRKAIGTMPAGSDRLPAQ